MQTVRVLAVGVLFIGWMVPFVAWSKDVTPEEHKLLGELFAANLKREKPFGNMHAVWTMEKVKDGKKSESTIEFWSRDSKYFRFDETFEVGNFKVERYFIVPDRYVHFLSFSPDNRGVIVGHGTFEKGRKELRRQEWYCESNKRLHDPMRNLFEHWLKAEDTTLKVRRANEGGIEVEKRREGEGDQDGKHLTFANSEVLEFSPGDYRFLRSKFRLDISDGKWTEDVSKKVYGDASSDVLELPTKS